MTSSSEFKKKPLIDFIPNTWFSDKMNSSVWLSAYYVLRVSEEDLSPLGFKIIDLDDVIAIISSYKGMKYLSMDEPKIIAYPNGNYKFIQDLPKKKTLPDSIYLILMSPFEVDGKKGDESHVKKRIAFITSLIAVFIGRNIIFRHAFNTIVYLDRKKTITTSPVMENPDWFPKPDLNQNNLDLIQKSYEKIRNLDYESKNKVILSLRWFNSAFHDYSDAFLKYWIAIEALAMPTTNIKNVIKIIQQAYQLSSREANDIFMLGKLKGLRSLIFHGKLIVLRVPSNQYLLRYLEALYIDIFTEKLGLPFQNRAKTALDNSQFDLRKFIDGLLKKD